MYIIEMGFSIAQDGSLHIPAAEIKEMGFAPGDQVTVAFLSANGAENSFHEFLISPESLGTALADGFRDIKIPTELLIKANIPVDSDVDIACIDGAILILRSKSLSLAELEEIFNMLGLANQELQALIQNE